MKKVLVIVGPTAVGKTALSIELAKKYNGEIISGDSMQVYRELSIGTAKVTEAEKEGIPHYLIDIREKEEAYSVSEFQKEARTWIEAIHQRGKLPIVVGGTGLYIQALLYDFQLGGKQENDNPAIRLKYEQFAQDYGKEALWQLLQETDPLAAEKIHFNNQRKVIRALEVFETTGESITAPKEEPQRLYDYFLIGLTTDRELLYQRINQRVDLMMANGLLDEAIKIKDIPKTQAALGIGYKEFFPYFQGQATLEEVAEEIKLHSRRYAKRQLTWFRNRLAPYWVDLVQHPENLPELEKTIIQWLEVKE
ncbi:MAG TPA: tRNA (adenosine(37)-N6)-dimethylallyltransferase MiaA [Enterococcus sp.]|nr:tRNA (adenosine(37)-N6)-dimethylallyltransferase MiaA [Enterococcus sp.]HPR80628.1 tRNA (adenosine(37)-N6)-dimethylallyltransferase MiaA [Enterococcus sp.]